MHSTDSDRRPFLPRRRFSWPSHRVSLDLGGCRHAARARTSRLDASRLGHERELHGYRRRPGGSERGSRGHGELRSVEAIMSLYRRTASCRRSIVMVCCQVPPHASRVLTKAQEFAVASGGASTSPSSPFGGPMRQPSGRAGCRATLRSPRRSKVTGGSEGLGCRGPSAGTGHGRHAQRIAQGYARSRADCIVRTRREARADRHGRDRHAGCQAGGRAWRWRPGSRETGLHGVRGARRSLSRHQRRLRDSFRRRWHSPPHLRSDTGRYRRIFQRQHRRSTPWTPTPSPPPCSFSVTRRG